MRVTFSSLNRHMQYVINDRYGDLARLQEKLSTGKRLLRPSDDPVDVANDLKLRTKVNQMEEYKRNIDDGLSFMSVTDTAMLSMNDLLQRMRELAIQGASDTQSATERRFIAQEAMQLTRQVITLANTNYKGDYIFAGTETKIKPFPIMSSTADGQGDYDSVAMAYYDASGAAPGTAVQIHTGTGIRTQDVKNILPGTFRLFAPDPANPGAGQVEYQEGTDFTVDYTEGTISFPPGSPLSTDIGPGTPLYADGMFRLEFDYIGQARNVYNEPVSHNGDIHRQIEHGVVTPINITGDELTVDTATGTDLMEVMIEFGAALLHSDTTEIERAIGRLDTGFKTVLAAQTKNGARMNRFEVTLERNDRQVTEATRLQAELEDADYAEMVMKFQQAQTVYDAALKSAARVIQPSLANYL
jgi:flagellar hook-associated protein 3 FlgL